MISYISKSLRNRNDNTEQNESEQQSKNTANVNENLILVLEVGPWPTCTLAYVRGHRILNADSSLSAPVYPKVRGATQATPFECATQRGQCGVGALVLWHL